jgi:hypothetical protein
MAVLRAPIAEGESTKGTRIVLILIIGFEIVKFNKTKYNKIKNKTFSHFWTPYFQKNIDFPLCF